MRIVEEFLKTESTHVWEEKESGHAGFQKDNRQSENMGEHNIDFLYVNGFLTYVWRLK